MLNERARQNATSKGHLIFILVTIMKKCKQGMNIIAQSRSHDSLMLRTKEMEVKLEESEKASSHQESNPGHLACAASALPLSYDNRTTTSPQNPLHVQQKLLLVNKSQTNGAVIP